MREASELERKKKFFEEERRKKRSWREREKKGKEYFNERGERSVIKKNIYDVHCNSKLKKNIYIYLYIYIFSFELQGTSKDRCAL